MYANLMDTQIFHLIKYDLDRHLRLQKVTFMIILTFTYVLVLVQFVARIFCV